MHNTKEMFQRKKNGRGVSKIGDEPLLLPEKRISLVKRTKHEGKFDFTGGKRDKNIGDIKRAG